MTGRTALILLDSTLHDGAGPHVARMVAEQVAMLRRAGHERVIGLGTGDSTAEIEVLDAGGAAERLRAESHVTVLAHGVVIEDGALRRCLTKGTILATRSAHDEWDRIDADRAWAGVLVWSGERVADTLDELGEWDGQATLLRRALQAELPRLPLEEAQAAHGFGDARWAGLVDRRVEERLASYPLPLSDPVLRLLSRLVRALPARIARPERVGWALTVVVAIGCIGLALAGPPAAAAAMLPLLLVVGGAASLMLRLAERPAAGPWVVACAVAASAVVALGARAEPVAIGVLLALTTLLALSVAALWSVRMPGWLRLDALAALFALGTVVAGPLLALAVAAPSLLLSVLSAARIRAGARAAWRRLMD